MKKKSKAKKVLKAKKNVTKKSKQAPKVQIKLDIKKKIETTKAPKAIGPYSQAIKYGAFLFCSGQVPISPETGGLIGEDVSTQTTQALSNVKNLVESTGAKIKDIVKTTVFLTDMAHFAAFNETYENFFKTEGVSDFPARSTVAVRELPRKALVEIEALVCT